MALFQCTLRIEDREKNNQMTRSQRNSAAQLNQNPLFPFLINSKPSDSRLSEKKQIILIPCLVAALYSSLCCRPGAAPRHTQAQQNQ